MTVIVTVRPVTRAAEVSRFVMEQGEPASGAEWEVLETVPVGETRDFYAHDAKAIMVRTIPANNPET